MKQSVIIGKTMLWCIGCICIWVKSYGIYSKRNSCLGMEGIKDGVLIDSYLHMIKIQSTLVTPRRGCIGSCDWEKGSLWIR